jgi:hypothetical protein
MNIEIQIRKEVLRWNILTNTNMSMYTNMLTLGKPMPMNTAMSTPTNMTMVKILKYMNILTMIWQPMNTDIKTDDGCFKKGIAC